MLATWIFDFPIPQASIDLLIRLLAPSRWRLAQAIISASAERNDLNLGTTREELVAFLLRARC